MPLHKPKSVATYHQQLAYCLTQVGERKKREKEREVVGGKEDRNG
jgi:hypothetical protein